MPQAEPGQDDGLQRHETDRQAKDGSGLVTHQAEIERHAGGCEKETQQQALERLDVGFELMAIGAFRQQRAGEERAQRGRNANLLHQEGDADDRQQGGRRHRFLDARQGHEADHIVEREIADDDDERDHAQRAQCGHQVHGLSDGTGRGCEQRRKRDERNGGEILEQQHGEAHASVTLRKISGFLHDLQGECRRRQRQREADERRRCQLKPNTMATAPSSIAVITTCWPPSEKIADRMAHRRRGRSSRPMMNSSRMMPNSASSRNSRASDDENTWRKPYGPSRIPAIR